MPTAQQEAITDAREAASADLSAAWSSGDDDWKSGEEWQLALRIAASKGLSKSSFLPNFLLYICEQSLTGNAQQITEQRIGTEIFHRASGL